MDCEKKYKFELKSKKVLEDEEALVLYNEKNWEVRTLSNLSIGVVKDTVSMGEKENSICLKKEKMQLIINKKLFKKPTNWNILELEDDVIVASYFCSGQLSVFNRKCEHFVKKFLTNYSNTLKKLANHRSVSPQNVYKSFTNGMQHKLTFIAWIPVCFNKTWKNFVSQFLRLSENLLSHVQAYSMIKCNQIFRKNSSLWSRSHADVWRGYTSSHWHARISKLDS